MAQGKRVGPRRDAAPAVCLGLERRLDDGLAAVD
jgi:hypothetical protein